MQNVNDQNSAKQTSSDESVRAMNPAKMLQRVLQGLETQGDDSEWTVPQIDSVGGYRVEAVIGRGGMGAVYKVRHVGLQRVCALKLLPVSADLRPDFGERFMQEARAMARLHHPNILHVYDFGRTDDGYLYYVMEYVEGADLSLLMKEGGVDPDHAREIVLQVCDALHYAHRMGFVHRDIKLGNIILDDQGGVKVADFGLAKMLKDENETSAADGALTMLGEVMGTPGYMSPEQSRGDPVDHRTDIYALGVIYYQMLTGSLPLGHFHPPSAIAKSDSRLDAVVMRLLSTKPEDRYQQAMDVRNAITVSSGTVAKRDAGKRVKLGVIAAIVGAFALASMAFIRNSESPKTARTDQLPVSELPDVRRPHTNSLGMSFLPVRGTSVLFSQWETRWDDWDQFIKETGYAWQRPTFNAPGGHPALNVSWQDANAFCKWLTKKERAAGTIGPDMIYRLPTDKEWSCAVGLISEQGSSPEQRSGKMKNDYPWGQEWPPPEDVALDLDQSEAFDIVEGICFGQREMSRPMQMERQENIIEVSHKLYRQPWRKKAEKIAWKFILIPQELGNAMTLATDRAVVRYWNDKTVVLLGGSMGHHAASLIETIGWKSPDWTDPAFLAFFAKADWGKPGNLKVWTCIRWNGVQQAYCLGDEKFPQQKFETLIKGKGEMQLVGMVEDGKVKLQLAPPVNSFQPIFIFDGRLAHEDLVKTTEEGYRKYQTQWFDAAAKLYSDLLPLYENEWRKKNLPVNSGPKNQFGIQGLSGGAKEWVADDYSPNGSQFGTLRGGSIRLMARGPRLEDLEGAGKEMVDEIVKSTIPAKEELLSSYRLKDKKDSRKPWYGFRAVLAFDK